MYYFHVILNNIYKDILILFIYIKNDQEFILQYYWKRHKSNFIIHIPDNFKSIAEIIHGGEIKLNVIQYDI